MSVKRAFLCIAWFAFAYPALAGGSHLRAAEEALRAGRTDLAEESLTTQIQEEPLSFEAYLLMARIQIDKQAWAEAESALRKAVWLKEDPQAFRLLRQVRARQGYTDRDRVIVDDRSVDRLELQTWISQMNAQNARDIQTLFPENRYRELSLYWIARARAERFRGNDAGTLNALHQALLVDPDEMMARYEAAEYWEKRGNFKRAAEHLSYILATHPEEGRAVYRFARIQILRRRKDLAAQALRARAKLFPHERWVSDAIKKMQLALESSAQTSVLDDCELSRVPASQGGRTCSH